MPHRVIVDENAGPGSRVWDEYQRAIGDRSAEFLFLNEAHPGIPDVEILDKLLRADTVLLTGDRVLHMQALARGFRSYTLNEQGRLTRRKLPGIHAPPLPQSVHRELQATYHYQPTNDIAHKLKAMLKEKQFKHYRTTRRRIRSHFGSAAAISQVSITVGAKPTAHGLLCGFVFQLASSSGVPGLRASEGYCVPADGGADPAYPVIHALRDLFLLQFDQIRTEMFVLPAASLELCRELQVASSSNSALHETLRQLIQATKHLTWQPCVKGRFFDSMNRKLEQLVRRRSNEVTTLDFERLTACVLRAGADSQEAQRDSRESADLS